MRDHRLILQQWRVAPTKGVHHQRGRNRESNRGKSAELKEANHLFVNVSKDAINGHVKLDPTQIIDIVGEFIELGVQEVDPRREKAEELEKVATELSLSSVTKLIDLFCKRVDRLKNGSNTLGDMSKETVSKGSSAGGLLKEAQETYRAAKGVMGDPKRL